MTRFQVGVGLNLFWILKTKIFSTNLRPSLCHRLIELWFHASFRCEREVLSPYEVICNKHHMPTANGKRETWVWCVASGWLAFTDPADRWESRASVLRQAVRHSEVLIEIKAATCLGLGRMCQASAD